MDDKSKEELLQYSDDPIIKEINREVIQGIYYSWLEEFDRYNSISKYKKLRALPGGLMECSEIMYFNYMKKMTQEEILNYYRKKIRGNTTKYLDIKTSLFVINAVDKEVIFSPVDKIKFSAPHFGFTGPFALTDRERDAIIDRINGKEIEASSSRSNIPIFYQNSEEVSIIKNGENVMGSGCHFISIVYGVSQLIGFNFTADEIKRIAEDCFDEGFVSPSDMLVIKHKELVRYIFEKIGIKVDVELNGGWNNTIKNANKKEYAELDKYVLEIKKIEKETNPKLTSDIEKLERDNAQLENDKKKLEKNNISLENEMKEVIRRGSLSTENIEKSIENSDLLWILLEKELVKTIGRFIDEMRFFRRNNTPLLSNIVNFNRNGAFIEKAIRNAFQGKKISEMKISITGIRELKSRNKSFIEDSLKRIKDNIKLFDYILDYMKELNLNYESLTNIIKQFKKESESLEIDIKKLNEKIESLMNKMEKIIENRELFISNEKKIAENKGSIESNEETIKWNNKLVKKNIEEIKILRDSIAAKTELYAPFLNSAKNNASSTFVIKYVHSARTKYGTHFILADKDGNTIYDPTRGFEEGLKNGFKLYEIRTFKISNPKKI